MEPRAKLAEMFANGETIAAPGVFDPIGGKVVQKLGFKAAYHGGFITGAHLATTEPLLTMSEQVETSRRITNVVDIPLIVDGHSGWGEPIHIMRTVREFERAGVAAIHIEDQQFPKRAHYHKGVEYICDRDEFMIKLNAALEARTSPDFKIIARTDAGKAINGDWKEAVRRCHDALEAGADAVMPLVREEEDILNIRKELPDDAIVAVLSGWVTGTQVDKTIEQYRDLGFRMILFALPSIAASAGAQWSLYKHVMDHGRVPESGTIGFDASEFPEMLELVKELIGLPEFYAIEEKTVQRQMEKEQNK